MAVSVDQLVHRLNVENLSMQLQSEADPERRKMMQMLLAEEERKARQPSCVVDGEEGPQAHL